MLAAVLAYVVSVLVVFTRVHFVEHILKHGSEIRLRLSNA
jgi:hypothetical protein